MKAITQYLNENKNNIRIGDLEYVMTYENFIKWIKKQDIYVSYYSFAQVDQDNSIDKLLADESQQGILRFDNETNEWEVIIDDEGIPANSLSLGKNDIMLLFRKNNK